MKIAVFGATGRTGKQIVEQALAAGHEVIALARTPEKIKQDNPNLRVIPGDVADALQVEKVISGADAVISAMGPTSNEPVFAISRGMEHILAAMKKYNVHRLVISAGAGVGDPADTPGLFNKLMNILLKAAAKNVFEDMRKTVALVRASDRDWTVVRVPMLTDNPKTGSVKVGMVGKGMGSRVSRADMATYMLEQVGSREQVGKAPAISSHG